MVLTNASRGFGGVFGVRLDGIRADRTWTKRLSISHGSTVCVDGQVYAASSRGEARGWVAVDAATGTPRVMSDLARGSLIYADGHFYCLTERGMMTLQKPAGSRFETVGSFQFTNGKDVWAHPVVCNGRLFLRFHETLSCYDIGQSDGCPRSVERRAGNTDAFKSRFPRVKRQCPGQGLGFFMRTPEPATLCEVVRLLHVRSIGQSAVL